MARRGQPVDDPGEGTMSGLEQRVSRRALLAGALGLAAGAVVSHKPAMAAPGGSEESLVADYVGLENVVWPPDLGQSELQVYFRKTGHTLRGTFLDYWRANGGMVGFGAPISEPFALNGYYSQAFERAVLQYLPEYQYTEQPVLRSAPIGTILARAHGDLTNTNGQRRLGGGDRRSAVWTPLDPNGDSVARALNSGGIYFEGTGHTVTGDFLGWYQSNQGPYFLGQPISQVFKKNGVNWQYFEGGALRHMADGVHVAPLAKLAMSRLGIDLTPLDANGLPEFDEALFVTAPNPNPVGPADAPGRRWIEINITQQRMWAYQGSTQIMTSLVSTGLDPNFTSEGTFYIRIKFPKQDMKGFTSDTGEVVGFGEPDEAPDGTSSYEVKDVPDVMYFTQSAEALHGAYWHNNFGNPMSHGCVNQPLNVAKFMYGWAPLGTMVWVHK
jgi:hypothetical protein